MKLASLRSKKSRHGELVVVSRDNRFAVRPPSAKEPWSLLAALEDWEAVFPVLKKISEDLNRGQAAGAFELKVSDCGAPLPFAPGFYDGSAFLSHVVRARRARGDEMPASAKVTPLMYQGVSDHLLPFDAPIDLMDLSFGGDFEGEFAVIVREVPKGARAGDLQSACVLLTLFNDLTFREIVKVELETKFGFLQSKPNSAFAPFVVTPDELGAQWDGKRVHLDLEVLFNGKPFGKPNGREMAFSFPELVAHACRTRPLAAGSIVGSGTVSNEDPAAGFACLTEKRFQEILDGGKPVTPWLKAGDRVTMDVRRDGVSVFGAIDEVAVL